MSARLLVSAGTGVLFGAGLALSGMTDPARVLGFLDISGRWDPTLLLVLGGAVGVTAATFRRVLRRERALLGDRFDVATRADVDVSLVLGSALFGAGWGISGYCPGPAVAMLAAPTSETAVFLPAMVAGLALHRWWGRGPDRARRPGLDASSSQLAG